MRQIYKQFSVISGFAILLAVLVINAALTRQRIAVQDSNQGWVEHTQRVQLELTTVESLLKDAETGQRGYLYTGEAKYLEPYNTAVQQVDSHIANLAELVTDKPQQLSRVVILRNLSKIKLEELSTTIALFGEGRKDEARGIVLSDMGKRTMDNIRAAVAEMTREESSSGVRAPCSRQTQRAVAGADALSGHCSGGHWAGSAGILHHP